MSSEYLYYLLIRLKSQSTRLATGSAFGEIGKRDIASINVSLPTSNEQRAVAGVLSDMDGEITEFQRRLDKSRAIEQGMMQQLLTGRVRLVEPDTAAAP